LYTYLGARAFPGVFIGFGCWLLLRGARPTRRDLLRIGTLAAVAIVVAAPLAAFFVLNPGTFSARMQQVFIFLPGVNGGHPWEMLADNTLKMLKSFTISGEPMWRYNIPGRPMFVGAVGIALYGGAIVLLRRLGQRDDAAALVLIWIAAMFFPSLLSWDVGAYTLRAMGLVPAVYFVPALGLDWLWRVLARRWTWGPKVATVLVGLVLLVDTGWTARDYFVVWAPSFGAAWEGMADSVAQARFLDRAARPAQEDVFVSNPYYHHPTLAQIARPVYPSLRWFDGTQSVAFSPDSQRPALYVLAFSGMPSEVNQLFPASDLVGSQSFPSGIYAGTPPPLFLAYRLTPDQIRAQVRTLLDDPRMRPVAGQVAGLMKPLGARLDGPVRPGETLNATLAWQVIQKPPPGQYQMLAQLLDQRWREVSDVEGLGYPTQEWRPGDVVFSHYRIPVPKQAAPGLYKVQVAIYHRDTDRRLPIEGGQPGIAGLILGEARVVASQPPPAPSVVLNARLGTDVDLIGIDPPKRMADGALSVTLHWRADRPLDEDYTAFVQLLNGAGQLVAQSDSQPASGELPTTSWLPGETVLDPHSLPLQPDLPAGRYRLIAGMYLLKTGQRLPVDGGKDYVDLTSVSFPLPLGEGGGEGLDLAPIARPGHLP
ncbi:MAG: hypothetical protein ACRDIY_18210, partial [Chloroflexota bacterium]